MTVNALNRMVAAAGISVLTLFGLSVPANAQPQQDQRQETQEETKQQRATKRAQQEQDKQQQQAQKRQEQQQDRLAELPQRPRMAPEDQQRLSQYREQLGQQQVLAQQQSAQLQRQNRTAQFRIQQQYLTRMRQQQSRIQSQPGYNYGRDPYFYTAPSYRYARGGGYYETNQYGVDLLRQAVNYGYGEGCRAGLADRQDRWDSNYEDSFAYQDANYGYGGFYVDRNDYNTYFREGFRRGYEDGYNGRHQYGRYSSGRGTMLGSVLATILNFELIR